MGKKREKKVKEKKEKKPGKKKLLLIIIPVILVLGAAGGVGAYLFLTTKAPDNYWDEKEKVSSVTKVVGDRKCKVKKDEDTVTYTYKEVKDSKADVEKYVKYLEEKKKFSNIQGPEEKVIKGEDKKDAKKDDKKDKDKKDKEEKDKEEKDKEKDDGTHYELGADSKKKGKLLKVTIDVGKDSYTVKVETGKGTLAERQELIEKASKEEGEKNRAIEEAVDKIKGLSKEQLGISVSPDELTFIPYTGRIQVKGEDYYKVTAYSMGEGGVTCFEGSYLADCRELEDLYKYNEQTQACTRIK